jgi:hypothetical protein
LYDFFRQQFLNRKTPDLYECFSPADDDADSENSEGESSDGSDEEVVENVDNGSLVL